MDIALLYLIPGIILLTCSSDWFVTGAIQIAEHFKIPPLLIGLTIVSLGTSAPEIMVSVLAAIDGKAELAIANVIGSNIANIGFVLGGAALIAPITVKLNLLKQEFPISFVLMGLTAICFWDNLFSKQESLLFFCCMSALLLWFYYQVKRKPTPLENQAAQKNINLFRSCFYFFVGLISLLLSAKAVVTGAVLIAQQWGVSNRVIGLTIVALGTSLPEAATSIMAALKNQQDIAIGNVLGSNILNLTLILPIVGFIHPGMIDPLMLLRDIPAMIGISLLSWIWIIFSKNHVSRLQGAVLLMTYIGYLIYVGL